MAKVVRHSYHATKLEAVQARMKFEADYKDQAAIATVFKNDDRFKPFTCIMKRFPQS